MLSQRHLGQPLRHGNSVLADVRERLSQRLTLQRRLVDRKPDRYKQHQSDEDRKRKRRPDIRRPAGDARGVLSIGRPDGQGDDDGPAQRRQEILRHPEGEDD